MFTGSFPLLIIDLSGNGLQNTFAQDQLNALDDREYRDIFFDRSTPTTLTTPTVKPQRMLGNCSCLPRRNQGTIC
jgi:hypothetical protein